jgi:epoxyqueuosine reductase QueG
MTLLESLRVALAPSGLNLLGITDVAAYDAQVRPARQSHALCPASRSIIVVGSGGPALWGAFLADLERTPAHLTHERHPLESFVKREIDRADAVLQGVTRRWFFASSDAAVQLDFQLLGYLAGLGGKSRLRLLMNAQHGPWLGLRAACFLAADLPAAAPGGPDLCAGCPAPCVSACPGNALPEGYWDVDRCSAYHRESDRCATGCHARLACPRGVESRYPLEEIHYHSNSHTGRSWLRAHLGIAETADHYPGAPPLWASWRTKINTKE